MTDKEAIEIINVAKAEVEWEYPMDYAAAFDKAIEVLKMGGYEEIIENTLRVLRCMDGNTAIDVISNLDVEKIVEEIERGAEE